MKKGEEEEEEEEEGSRHERKEEAEESRHERKIKIGSRMGLFIIRDGRKEAMMGVYNQSLVAYSGF